MVKLFEGCSESNIQLIALGGGGASVTTPLKMNNAKDQLALIRGSNRILRTSASWKNDCCNKINAEFEVHDVMFFTAKQYSVAAI